MLFSLSTNCSSYITNSCSLSHAPAMRMQICRVQISNSDSFEHQNWPGTCRSEPAPEEPPAVPGTCRSEPAPEPSWNPSFEKLTRNLPGTCRSEPAPQPSRNPWFGTCPGTFPEPALEPSRNLPRNLPGTCPGTFPEPAPEPGPEPAPEPILAKTP